MLRRKLIRDLLARKGSLGALLVIVALGVSCFHAMAGVYRDLDGARARYYRQYRLADFSIEVKRAPGSRVPELAEHPNVKAIRGRVRLPVLIDLDGVPRPVTGSAISLPAIRTPVINGVLVKSGAWFSRPDADEVLVNEAFAAAHGIRPGQRLKVLMNDGQHELLVVGTAMSPEFVYLMAPGGGLAPDPANFGVLYLSLETLQRIGDLDGAVNQIVGEAHRTDRDDLQRTLDDLERDLADHGVLSATPSHDQPSVQFLADELRGLRVSAFLLPGLFLGVAALILNVLMARFVTQQRTIIGTLLAIGYRRGQLLRHYMAFGAIIGIAGAAVGEILGHALQQQMVEIYRMFYALPGIERHTYQDLLLGGFLFSVTFALLGTIQGVRLALRLEPAEAMRPPPPERGGTILLERVPMLFDRLSFRSRMVLRTIFRNPFRSLVNVLATAIATGLVVQNICLVDSIYGLMDHQFRQVARDDFSLAVRDPLEAGFTRAVSDLAGVSGVESQLSIVCDLSSGTRSRRIGVIGQRPGDRLQAPLDGDGHRIAIPRRGLLLNQALADRLEVAAGDTVTLRPTVGRRERVQATVAGLYESYMGLSAYGDLEYLSRLLGEDQVANQVLGRTWSSRLDETVLDGLRHLDQVTGVADRRHAYHQLEATFGEVMLGMLWVIVGFSGMIAFGTVFNSAIVSLDERKRDVSTFLVIGYTPGEIAQIFTGESLLLNATGILVGLGLGIGLVEAVTMAYSTEMFRFPTVIHPSRLLFAAIAVGLFVAAAQVMIYRLIRRLDWLDVLKVKE